MAASPPLARRAYPGVWYCDTRVPDYGTRSRRTLHRRV